MPLQCSKALDLFKAVSNWYELVFYRLGLRHFAELRFRNGLKFRYITGAGIHGIFLAEEYKDLDFLGKDVVDVGAFIGDSTVYSAWKGARRVYAYEPFPYAYRFAVHNVQINHMKNVLVYNAAVGGRDGQMRINPTYASTIADKARDFGRGALIPVLSLESIVKEHNLKDAALKLDCEGSEYDVVCGSSNDTLGRFSSIIVEYHRGPQLLIQRFVAAGFDFRLINSAGVLRRPDENLTESMGLMLAFRC